VRKYLQEMEDTTYLTVRWRLRYSTFLSAIFDNFVTKLQTGVSKPAQLFGTSEDMSHFLVKIIEISIVSFLTPADLGRLFPHGLR
jgi:hypothetical protein